MLIIQSSKTSVPYSCVHMGPWTDDAAQAFDSGIAWTRNVCCDFLYHLLPVPHTPHNAAKSDAAPGQNATGCTE